MEERRANGPTEIRQKTTAPESAGLVGDNKESGVNFEADKMDWRNKTEEVIVSKMPDAWRSSVSNLP
jgi:hypothetical protein